MSLICRHYKTLNLQLEQHNCPLRFCKISRPFWKACWFIYCSTGWQVFLFTCISFFCTPGRVAHMGFLHCLLSAIVMYLGLSRCGKTYGMKVKRRHPAFPWKWVSYCVNKLVLGGSTNEGLKDGTWRRCLYRSNWRHLAVFHECQRLRLWREYLVIWRAVIAAKALFILLSMQHI